MTCLLVYRWSLTSCDWLALVWKMVHILSHAWSYSLCLQAGFWDTLTWSCSLCGFARFFILLDCWFTFWSTQQWSCSIGGGGASGEDRGGVVTLLCWLIIKYIKQNDSKKCFNLQYITPTFFLQKGVHWSEMNVSINLTAKLDKLHVQTLSLIPVLW